MDIEEVETVQNERWGVSLIRKGDQWAAVRFRLHPSWEWRTKHHFSHLSNGLAGADYVATYTSKRGAVANFREIATSLGLEVPSTDG